MKTFDQFLFEKEQKAITIEQLADVCKKIVQEISKKIGVPFGLVQQGIVMVEKPAPHIHCQFDIIENGLEDNDKFITKEICDTFAKSVVDYGLTTKTLKNGDVIAEIEVVKN